MTDLLSLDFPIDPFVVFVFGIALFAIPAIFYRVFIRIILLFQFTRVLKYAFGYPSRLILLLVMDLLLILFIFGFFFGLIGLGLLGSGYLLTTDFGRGGLIPISILLVFLLAFLYLSKKNLEDFLIVGRIVPYFRERLSHETDTFWQGKWIAKNCRNVDRLCQKLECPKFSDFGFRDDHFHERVRWHDASKGLAILKVILPTIESNPDEFVEAGKLVEELANIESALELAMEKDIPFALIVRTGADSVVSFMEFDNRIGSFW